jgi:hypothetical protein
VKFRRLIFALLLLAGLLRGAEKDPPAISLHLTDASPRDALAELEKQTGIKFASLPEIPWADGVDAEHVVPNQISIDLDNKSFWSVMHEICLASKLDVAERGNYDDITIAFNEAASGVFGDWPTFVGPAATIVVTAIHHKASIDLTQKDITPQRDIAVELNAYIDPRLHMIQRQQYNGRSIATVETAFDENGKSILAPPPQDSSFGFVTSPWLEDPTIPLDYESGKSKRLATLKGSIRIIVATASETLEIDDLPTSTGKEKNVAGTQFKMTTITVDGKNLSFEFTLKRTEMDKAIWERAAASVSGMLRLQRVDGTIGGVGSDYEIRGDILTYKAHVHFDKDQERPAKLIWEIPTATEERDLPFEFKDLPLP